MILGQLRPSGRGVKRARSGRGFNLRGLGTISTQVGQSLVFSPNPVGQAAPTRTAPVRGFIVQPSAVHNNLVMASPISSIRRYIPVTGPIATTPIQVGGPYPVYGGGAPPGWTAGGSPYGSSPLNPTNSQALAAAQALLATNPSFLTPQQFAMLQAAGLVSNTLPYSSVSQITPTNGIAPALASTVNDPNCIAAGCTGGPYPNCTCAATATSSTDIGTMLDTTYAGLPLYLWLIVGGGGLYLMTKKGR